jgi:hypothetical protein
MTVLDYIEGAGRWRARDTAADFFEKTGQNADRRR